MDVQENSSNGKTFVHFTPRQLLFFVITVNVDNLGLGLSDFVKDTNSLLKAIFHIYFTLLCYNQWSSFFFFQEVA